MAGAEKVGTHTAAEIYSSGHAKWPCSDTEPGSPPGDSSSQKKSYSAERRDVSCNTAPPQHGKGEGGHTREWQESADKPTRGEQAQPQRQRGGTVMPPPAVG